MKKNLMLTAAAIAISATMATADTVDDVIATLTADGYVHIHVRPASDVIRVVAMKDGVRLDVAYDATSGAVLSEETREARAEDDEGNGRLRAAPENGEGRPPRSPRPEGAERGDNDGERRGPPPRGPRPEGAEDGENDGERRGPRPRGPRPEGAEDGDNDGERRGPPPRGPRPPRGDDAPAEE
jgi:hypothetical protein